VLLAAHARHQLLESGTLDHRFSIFDEVGERIAE
jgi:hypothetical protein